MSRKPRVLFWDLETSYMVAAIFSLYPDSIPHSNIIKEPFIMCASWKWLGQDKVHHVKLTKRQLKKGNDKSLVKKVIKVIEKADLVVAHNGDAFDLKYLKGRALRHGLEPFSFVRTVDTLKMARRNFKLPSNRLDYLGSLLFKEGKFSTSAGLWMRCLEGDTKALKEMVDYNKVDVELLEKVYLALRPWTENHPNCQVYLNNDKVCKACGESNIIKYGIAYTQARRYQKYQCKSCGHIYKSNKTIKEKK